MAHPQSPMRRYTLEEYQALEEVSEQRHEFFEGEVYGMSGATPRHNLIAQNCAFALRQAVRGKGCRVFLEGVQLAVQAGHYHTYPDVMVTCDADDLAAERTMHHPVLIIEILSPSTADHDRSWKFNQYKQLSSLQHYLLVSQHTCLVEWFRREESGVWSFTPLGELTDTLKIPELDAMLRVQDIYDEIDITPMRAQPPAEL
ncbi:Uma2 family endonuclease [Hymenobacter sp. DG25A]|uniref:Uma2 family endonuclease n=1 Tax=Hymenobacter sp. DG25A TaxID=1385663 RepID=UPI0006BC1602|nr:Uma2 family endonuclease [Hymenobacter sp. DG25A]ALD21736.1 hypothetical protein AM218_11605 [Hymenobacter sp. DG25A]